MGSLNEHRPQNRHHIPPKCQCCPYGFHIDLDFVQFAQSVANGSRNFNNDDDNGVVNEEVKTFNKMTEGSNKRINCSPINSIFSDSLENIVSDFEEALQSRCYVSDRESVRQIKPVEVPRANGYYSDYGTNRLLPPKTPHLPLPKQTAKSLTPKPYRTALARTMLEINSKRRFDEIADSVRQASNFEASSHDYRPLNGTIEHFKDLLPRELHRKSPHEQQTSVAQRLLERKTPKITQNQMKLGIGDHYQSDSESITPHRWRTCSPVQRSSSAIDMDGFASIRRRKNSIEQQYRSPSVQSSERSQPHALVYSDLAYSPRIDTNRWRREQSSPPTMVNDFSTIEQNVHCKSNEKSTARNYYSNNAAMPSDWKLERNTSNRLLKEVSYDRNQIEPLMTNFIADRAINDCFECHSLKKQLFDLSKRLAIATSEMEDSLVKSKCKLDDVDAGSSAILNCNHLSPKTDQITQILNDKNISVNAKLFKENGECCCATSTVNVAEKATNTSSKDSVNRRDAANSPIPKVPQCYSIGIVTENNSLKCAAAIESLIECDKATNINSTYYNDFGCSTEAKITAEKSSTATVSMQDYWTLTDSIRHVSEASGSDKVMNSTRNVYSMTSPITLHCRALQTDTVEQKNICIATKSKEMIDRGSDPGRAIEMGPCTSAIYDCSAAASSNDGDEVIKIEQNLFKPSSKLIRTIESQTEFDVEPSEPRVLNDSEIAASLWLMPSKDSADIAVGNDDDVVKPSDLETFHVRSNGTVDSFVDGDEDDDENILIVEETLSDPEESILKKSIDELSSNKQVEEDAENCKDKLGDMEHWKNSKMKSRPLGQARAAIVKKLLTEKSPTVNFVRGTAISKSWRNERKKGDSLQYIADRHKSQNDSMPSTPHTSKGALKEKVILKKDADPSPPLSKVPEPMPAKIPRPKITKYTPGETIPQSADEEAEIADRLTPLRSEMRTLRTYASEHASLQRNPAQNCNRIPSNAFKKSINADHDDSSSSSSDSEGSYETNETSAVAQFELTAQLAEAIDVLAKYFENQNSVGCPSLEWATKFAKHEWLKTAARKTASAIQVEGFIDALEAASSTLLRTIVNITDPNENTALHYAVSHGNFDVVGVLLDSKVCNLNRANKAGYTAVMLAALCDANDEVEAAVIHRLFQMGDINAQAVKHGQTALMLSVSHGKMNTTKLLIECEANLNIQDEEGSTALMCAAEHGHKEIVKLLLAQPDIDASLSDCDSSTALSIAVENGHRDIGVFIYAHLNHARGNDQSNNNESKQK